MIPVGFQFGGVRCGLKNKRNDLGIVVSDRPTVTCGVFTTNVVHAACVDYSREVVGGGRARAVVVNSGNANCCTGEQGVRDTVRMSALAANELGLEPDQVAVASTGVIGHLLDMAKVEKGVRGAAAALSDDPKPFMDAILTTDLVEKWAATCLDSRVVLQPDSPAATVGPGRMFGVAKGSGMIAPNMATMLSFIVSDLDVSLFDVEAVFRRVVGRSFNCMTVDGDTSTNDMLIVMANGASGIKATEAEFERLLTGVCVSLAKQIARDGEGATKLIEVRVTGSKDPTTIARTIANSPLVKTAMFGCDPNWGRVLMAAGRAGVPFDVSETELVIHAGGEEHVLFDAGAPAAFDAKHVSSALKGDAVVIDLRLGEGETATVYTCDFGYGYVRINAEYHT